MQIPKEIIEKAKEEGYKLAEKDFKDDHKVKYGLGLEAGKSEAFSLVKGMVEKFKWPESEINSKDYNAELERILSTLEGK